MEERIPVLKQADKGKSRKGNKLRWIIILLFLIAGVVLFFNSSFSKYMDIQVSGYAALQEEEVRAALQVEVGDSFFVSGISQLEARIKELPPVKEVRITKRFPGKLQVEVTEYPIVALQLSPTGDLSAVLATGWSRSISGDKAIDKPILSGWRSDDRNLAELCRILGELPASLFDDLSEIYPDPSVAYPDRIKLYTRSKFEVVTTVSKLSDKIAYLSDVVQNREPGQVIMLEANTYMPFSAQISSQ